jgi:hydrocephalus-inducing protein
VAVTCHLSPASGIDSSNLASIFEEHVVLSHLDPFQPINCSFGLKDKVFNFGTLIAQLPELLAPEPGVGVSPRDAVAAKKSGRPGASAKASARASMAPGAAAADIAAAQATTPRAAVQQDTSSLLDDPAAVKANLKFINPKKVPCTVNFSILPQNGSQPGALMQQRRSHCVQEAPMGLAKDRVHAAASQLPTKSCKYSAASSRQTV